MRRHYAGIGLLLAVAVGCSDGWPKLVPVSGKVTLDGKPLAYKSVYFHPEKGTPGTGAATTTKEDGSYTLLAIRNGALKTLPGVPAGAYRVVISEPMIPIEPPPAAEGPAGAPPPAVGPPAPSRKRPVIPARYNTPETTPLRAEVPPAGGTIDLLLTSRP
jgi:hypothetical protein